MTKQLQTPIAFIIFNRPKCTRRVFEEIRKARPQKLYLIADAPRPHKKGEAEKCAETRQLVESMIDWPCEVKTNYAETNMGCGKRIPSGLDWVFEHEESAIILEDDILADPTFFLFCEAMLERYRGNEKIMQVSGYNPINYHPNTQYFYSMFPSIWGWATWQNRWEKFHEIDPHQWEVIRSEEVLENACGSEAELNTRKYVLDQIFSGKLNAWGMRWDITRLLNNGLGVVPSQNLVRNIGFGPSASHTVNPFNRERFVRLKQLPTETSPPPTEIVADKIYDQKYRKRLFPNTNTERVKAALLNILKGQ